MGFSSRAGPYDGVCYTVSTFSQTARDAHLATAFAMQSELLVVWLFALQRAFASSTCSSTECFTHKRTASHLQMSAVTVGSCDLISLIFASSSKICDLVTSIEDPLESTIGTKRPGTIGKKDYKGTILDGRDSFDSWTMDLEDSLLSDDLMSYVTGEATPESSGLSTPGEKSAADIKNMSLARMKIRQSIDQIHRNSVNHLVDPRAIYQSLANRYAASNKARLRQLIRMMYDVSTQTHRTVQEKVDDLKRLRAQINCQDKDIVIHEQLLICFLQMSMDQGSQ
ncbi:copia-like retrotransposable element [Pochonia chlamydosporia 170]|uniref:Copia-like retrotransposable element n=1 Tax=Pochonia chlamydosporia 170 TaxID=1380566 RepID=A0A219ANL9_METCM|nr:copia-like retrotransposable element [Pochonia chlamydosporia 170]OWT42438.1 copia-like retrotransposable element [Pochonia chlamydosporia 170]